MSEPTVNISMSDYQEYQELKEKNLDAALEDLLSWRQKFKISLDIEYVRRQGLEYNVTVINTETSQIKHFDGDELSWLLDDARRWMDQ